MRSIAVGLPAGTPSLNHCIMGVGTPFAEQFNFNASPIKTALLRSSQILLFSNIGGEGSAKNGMRHEKSELTSSRGYTQATLFISKKLEVEGT